VIEQVGRSPDLNSDGLHGTIEGGLADRLARALACAADEPQSITCGTPGERSDAVGRDRSLAAPVGPGDHDACRSCALLGDSVNPAEGDPTSVRRPARLIGFVELHVEPEWS